MKKILLSLAMAVCSLGAWATGYNVLKLHLNDGSEVKIVLSEALRLNFTDTHLVATGGQTDVQVEKAVSRFSSISMTLPAVSTETLSLAK